MSVVKLLLSCESHNSIKWIRIFKSSPHSLKWFGLKVLNVIFAKQPTLALMSCSVNIIMTEVIGRQPSPPLAASNTDNTGNLNLCLSDGHWETSLSTITDHTYITKQVNLSRSQVQTLKNSIQYIPSKKHFEEQLGCVRLTVHIFKTTMHR